MKIASCRPYYRLSDRITPQFLGLFRIVLALSHARPAAPQTGRCSATVGVKIVDGTFHGHKGRVVDVNMQNGLVRVELILFEKPVPVELESWQIEKMPTVN